MAQRMSVVKVYSCFTDGMVGTFSEIEVSISPGLPTFDVIGLCDSSIRESRGRINSAIISSGFSMPKGHITVSISPAYMRKSGSSFDLPIAIGMLIASKQVVVQNERIYAQGELSLTGLIKGTPGSSLRLNKASEQKYDYLFFPDEEIGSANCSGIIGMAVHSLKEVMDIINSDSYRPEQFVSGEIKEDFDDSIDYSYLKGQAKAHRAILLSACGRHSVLLLGSPGCGKSMAGKIIHNILPKLEDDEIKQVYSMHEYLGIASDQMSSVRPFREISPSTSLSKLWGSAITLTPGEVALANHGVLFADEICEYKTSIIDSLRIPIEKGSVSLIKNGKNYVYPASFIFVAAGNPCRCGYLFDDNNKCKCPPSYVKRYKEKLSGPFLDRIDLFCEMKTLNEKELKEINTFREKTNAETRSLVKQVWDIQNDRYKELGRNIFNGSIQIDIPLDYFRADKRVLDYATDISAKFGFSARGYNRLLRVGRTCADLEGRADMNLDDINEAFLYRNRDF